MLGTAGKYLASAVTLQFGEVRNWCLRPGTIPELRGKGTSVVGSSHQATANKY
jgi:hypothetical protein